MLAQSTRELLHLSRTLSPDRRWGIFSVWGWPRHARSTTGEIRCIALNVLAVEHSASCSTVYDPEQFPLSAFTVHFGCSTYTRDSSCLQGIGFHTTCFTYLLLRCQVHEPCYRQSPKTSLFLRDSCMIKTVPQQLALLWAATPGFWKVSSSITTTMMIFYCCGNQEHE